MNDERAAAADEAYEAMRSIAHGLGGPLAPADVYEFVGSFKLAVHALRQVLTQTASALAGAVTVYDIGEGPVPGELEPRDPVDGIAAANASLRRAAGLIEEAGAELERAQSAIAGQWHRRRTE